MESAVAPMLTIDEVAERFQVTTRTVREWCAKGELQYVKLGRNVLRFKPAWLDEMIARKQQRD